MCRSVKQRVRALAFGAALLALLSCSPGLRGTPNNFQILVFPGEAELGGSAAAVIGSNYAPGADDAEIYDLERSRIGIRIKDESDVEWAATVRGVFPLQTAANSKLAEAFPGAWVTVVLFDLPTSASIDLGETLPFSADVIVRLDGVNLTQNEMIGTLRITGRGGAGIGGQPTLLTFPPITDLELDTTVTRFRPVADIDGAGSGGGFPLDEGGTQIGGIQGELVYFDPCHTDLEAYTGSEATNAGIYLGPPQTVPASGGWYKFRRFVITYPEGVTLARPEGAEEAESNALGEGGPILEVAHDRPVQFVYDCNAAVNLMMLWNVYAVRPDGTVLADQRGTGSYWESSNLFEIHRTP